jgi:hypothetical protein
MLKEEEPNDNRSVGRVGGDGGLDHIIAGDKDMKKEESDGNTGFDSESGEGSSGDAYRCYTQGYEGNGLTKVTLDESISRLTLPIMNNGISLEGLNSDNSMSLEV